MTPERVLWGDFHTHLDDVENGDALLQDAAHNIDFCATLCYPFRREERELESVGNRPEFLERWEKLRDLCRAHHQPGEFVTFLGYEWHGDRTTYGDHNVIYFDEDNPLDDAWTLPGLYGNLRKTRAFAIPHHTAYATGQRGKDWRVFDPDLSPVMEVYSQHGSSEGEDTPLPMDVNLSMGPRVSGGTLQDALDLGLRIGVIGSNDGIGLPGRPFGRAGVWAEDCTREAVWEAIRRRRTYAVTGDRILLDFRSGETRMGAMGEAPALVAPEVTVTASCAIERVELLLNNRVADVIWLRDRWPEAEGRRRYKLPLEFGWGPKPRHGLKGGPLPWDGRVMVTGGRILSVEKRFETPGQRVTGETASGCAWSLTTDGALRGHGMTQKLILEIEGDTETRLDFEVNGLRFDARLGDLAERSRLVPLLDASRRRFEESGLTDAQVGRRADVYFQEAQKIKLHRAWSEPTWRLERAFAPVELRPGLNSLYVRVMQVNGEMAWSSPIWMTRP